MKKYIAIVVVFALILSTITYAHPGTDELAIGGDDAGWISGVHNKTNRLTYRFDPNDPYMQTSLYQTMVHIGAAQWEPCGIITETTNSINIINTYYDKNTATMAANTNYFQKGAVHTDKFSIKINRHHLNENSAGSIDAFALSHEFGHSFGLGHVNGEKNKDALMYPNTGGYARAPSAKEVMGLSVIDGSHKHTFNRFVQASGQTHREYCGTCKGYVLQNCVFNIVDQYANWKCKCGRRER